VLFASAGAREAQGGEEPEGEESSRGERGEAGRVAEGGPGVGGGIRRPIVQARDGTARRVDDGVHDLGAHISGDRAAFVQPGLQPRTQAGEQDRAQHRDAECRAHLSRRALRAGALPALIERYVP
jgi:hypothetical protein